MKSNIATRLTALVTALFTLSLSCSPARASIAWGSINNFDTVNDTGHECHGFEIELEDCHSTDITYTFDWNHYGAPKITEDNSVAGHPKCIIRWESKKKPDGTWAAFTAIPSGPISPTDGHMFTDPSVNFGGEHFGVGYYSQPTAVRYNWLIDDGSGALVRGGAVQVSTPTFTYYPPAAAAVAQVQAAIVPPPAPAAPVKEFGPAVWVKEIRTTTHNNNEVKLRDLVSENPDHPEIKNWRNGEPDEVEVEWQILQTDYNKAGGGANGELQGAPENLNNGDEVVTRRYEFYKYTGPLDDETGEAMGASVGPDGIHGVGTKTINGVVVDLSTVEVVGDFTGAQMAAADVDAPVALVDHIGDGAIDTPYAARTLVIQGAWPAVALGEGVLPAGMVFDEVSGVLSGTPTESGQFAFRVTAFDGVNPDVSKNYIFTIAAAGEELPPTNVLDTVEQPLFSGVTTGDGSYAVGAEATVTATPYAGYAFANWTDNGKVVSTVPTYTRVMDVNHSLVAHFVPVWTISTSAVPMLGGTTTGDGVVSDGGNATVVATANAGYSFVNWTEGGVEVSRSATYTFVAMGDRVLVANFTAGVVINTSAAPVAGGTTSGGGAANVGASVTVVATASAGYSFVNWTENGTQVSTSASYTFTASVSRALVANFQTTGGGGGGNTWTVSTGSSPSAGGTTSGAGVYANGASVTVVAAPNPGYMFKGWQEGGVTVKSTVSYTFNATSNRALTAKFAIAATINTSVFPSNAGTTSGGGLFEDGDLVTLTASPVAGAMFVNWTENGVEVGNTPILTFRARPDTAPVRNLIANFTTGNNVTAYPMPAEGGVVTGGGSVPVGVSTTVTANANLCYVFTGWSDGGVIVSTSPSYTFMVTGSHTLVANFKRKPEMHAGQPVAGTMTFSWPAGDDDWVLQESTDLVHWVDSTRPVSIVNGQKQFNAATAAGTNLFFRLVRY